MNRSDIRMRQHLCRRLSAARRRQKYEPGLTQDSHLRLGLPRILLPCSCNSAALFRSLVIRHSFSAPHQSLCQAPMHSRLFPYITLNTKQMLKGNHPRYQTNILLSTFPIRGCYSGFFISSCSYLLQPQPCPFSPHP